MHSRERLANDFRRLGIRVGGTVMLHASVRAVGPVAGGPGQIHLALKDALTAKGTLMMYAVARVILTKLAGVTSRRGRSGRF